MSGQQLMPECGIILQQETRSADGVQQHCWGTHSWGHTALQHNGNVVAGHVVALAAGAGACAGWGAEVQQHTVLIEISTWVGVHAESHMGLHMSAQRVRWWPTVVLIRGQQRRPGCFLKWQQPKKHSMQHSSI